MMKTSDYVNYVCDGFRNCKGRGYLYCPNPIDYASIAKEIITRYQSKHYRGRVLVATDTFTRKGEINLGFDDTIVKITESIINPSYFYQYGLCVAINIKDVEKLKVITKHAKFILVIILDYSTNNEYKEFLNNNLTKLELNVSPNSIRTANIYSPVEETQIGINLTDEESAKYKEYTDYINDSMTIFGSLEVADMCRVGDVKNNISAATIRDNLARNNGWNERLDTKIDYYKQIDTIYNPNNIGERATILYSIISKRKKLVQNANNKIDAIKDIIHNNPNKKIIIIYKDGEFANNIASYFESYNIHVGQYHDDIPEQYMKNCKGEYITYKSGENKGKLKPFKSQALSTNYLSLYNNNEYDVLNIKFSTNPAIECACDILIMTTSIYEDYFAIKTRFRNINFNGNPTILYTLYSNDTIEMTKLINRKNNHLIKINNDVKNNITFD